LVNRSTLAVILLKRW